MADLVNSAISSSGEISGLRKLVRPKLTGQYAARRQSALKASAPLTAHQEPSLQTLPPGGTQAEVFYFQKQIQAQTPMVFVLDDGERIEGTIEWYDLNVIKVRHATRTMIYKSSIKYIYKADDTLARPASPGA